MVESRRHPASQLPTAEDDDRLLNAQQAAALFNMRPKSMYDLASQGRIPHLKLFGTAVRFRERDLRQIIAEAEIPVKPAKRSTVRTTDGFNRVGKLKKTNGKATVEPSQQGRGASSKKPN